MNEEMKAKLAKYMQDNGYYDTMAIRRDEGYSNRAASFFAIFGDDGEGREEERSELLAAADAYNEAKMAAEKAAQPAKPQTKTEIVYAPFEDLGQDSIIEVPVSENNEQPESAARIARPGFRVGDIVSVAPHTVYSDLRHGAVESTLTPHPRPGARAGMIVSISTDGAVEIEINGFGLDVVDISHLRPLDS